MIQCHRYDIFHIWLFLSAALVINLGYMLGIIEVFKSRFSAMAIILSKDIFYNGRNSPESLQAYDPALGG